MQYEKNKNKTNLAVGNLDRHKYIWIILPFYLLVSVEQTNIQDSEMHKLLIIDTRW